MLAIVQRQPVVAALAVAAAALVVMIGIETGFGSRLGPSIPRDVSRRAVPFEARLLPAIAPTDADQRYPEMVARPLFVPLRRPAPPPDATAQSAMKKGQFVLQGVIIAGDMRIALLREKSTGKVHRVEKGRELSGMKLSEVSPESVTLAQGSDQEVLPLQVLKPAPGGAATSIGPFGPGVVGGSLPPGAPQPAGNPIAAPPPPAAAPNAPVPQATFGPHVENPPAASVPQATTAPMSPEELLARRRARRAQQSQ
jgi:hypothetical protein